MKKILGAVGVVAALAFSTLATTPAMAATGDQAPIVTDNGIDPLVSSGWIKSVDGDLYVDGASIAPVAASLDTYTTETPGYDRTGMFGAAWVTKIDGCDTRNRILQRDFATFETRTDGCTVVTGVLEDPYSGETIDFQRTNYPTTGEGDSSKVQIDHIVPLKAAWNGGASTWTQEERIAFANDPVNLWASKGSLNASKGDRLFDTWTPPNDAFTCQYVAQMVYLLDEHDIAVTANDKSAMEAKMASAQCALPTTDVTPPVDPTVVTPTTPTVTPANECGVPGTVVFPIVHGVVYSSAGGDQGSIVIVATPEEGYTFPDGAVTRWVLDTIEECEVGTPTFTVPKTVSPFELADGIELPFTGFPANTDTRFVFALEDGTVLSDEMIAADADGAGFLNVHATLNGNAVPDGTVFTLTYYLDGKPVTQTMTATVGEIVSPPVGTEEPKGETGVTPDAPAVPQGEIAYTGGSITPALWIGGGVLAALIAGIAIFLVRRRRGIDAVVEANEGDVDSEQ